MTDSFMISLTHGTVVQFDYMNYRGEHSKRQVAFMGVYYGHNEWHPEDEFIMKAFDKEKKSVRYFAIKDITNLQLTAEEMTLTDIINSVEE